MEHHKKILKIDHHPMIDNAMENVMEFLMDPATRVDVEDVPSLIFESLEACADAPLANLNPPRF